MNCLKRDLSKIVFIFLNLIFIPNGITAQEKDTDVIRDKWIIHRSYPDALYKELAGEAFRMLEERKARADKIKDIKNLEEWKESIRQNLAYVLGPLPEKTPLNARITGTVKKNGFRIENVIFETMPGYYMTASLLIPEKIKKPAPAILFCSGHSSGAYRLDFYQQPLLNLVKKGFIVLAIDPVGQGERIQYWDSVKNASLVGGSTLEHSYCSAQVFLLGRSSAFYWIWDGIRSIDYLISRKEVDPKRIGVHGLSGGGTQAAYISALDDRVAAAAPACYITSFKRLLESIGPQDGEQVFYHGLERGLDHADLLEAGAPRPTLIMANTGDFFSIQGARESFNEIKKMYSLYGRPEDIQIVEDDYGHGYTRKNREAMYAFFQKYLDNPGSSSDEEVEYVPANELQKTTTGQLSTSVKGETVFSLNRKDAEALFSKLAESRKDPGSFAPLVIERAKNLSGFSYPDLPATPVFTGRTRKDNFSVEKYFIRGGENYVIPYLLMIPDKPNGKGIIYLDPGGKAAAADDNAAQYLVNKGFTLLVPDLIGFGEMGPQTFKGDAVISGIPYNIWFLSVMTGRSITGIHASDVIKLRMLLSETESIREVSGLALKELTPALIYAAAFDTAISGIALAEPYSSYRSFVENRFYYPGFVHGLVPGALTSYDIPDLLGTLAPRKLLITGTTGAGADRSNADEINRDLAVIKVSYDHKKAADQLIIKQDPGFSETIAGWLEGSEVN